MGITLVALDKFVSHNLSDLTECNAPELSGEFSEDRYWINNFVLNSMFRVPLKDEIKPFIFAILRRAETIFAEYEAGRIALQQYLSGPKDSLSLYFRALTHFESVVVNLYHLNEIAAKKLGQRLFEQKDGSPIYRLNRLCNVAKHAELSAISDAQLQSLWITNMGLSIHDAQLTWEELAELIRQAGRLADICSNPEPPTVENDGDTSGEDGPIIDTES